jgi:hypothetical protein
MNREEIEIAFDNGDLDEEYSAFIMDNADPSEWPICDGDSLIIAMEHSYLAEEFMDSLVK